MREGNVAPSISDIQAQAVCDITQAKVETLPLTTGTGEHSPLKRSPHTYVSLIAIQASTPYPLALPLHVRPGTHVRRMLGSTVCDLVDSCGPARTGNVSTMAELHICRPVMFDTGIGFVRWFKLELS